MGAKGIGSNGFFLIRKHGKKRPLPSQPLSGVMNGWMRLTELGMWIYIGLIHAELASFVMAIGELLKVLYLRITRLQTLILSKKLSRFKKPPTGWTTE